MSKSSKARRASYRRYANEQDSLSWSWKRQESGEVIPDALPDDLGQAHVMHKVGAGSQHMSEGASFAAFKAGDQAYMIGEAGGQYPTHLGYTVYIERMYNAGLKRRHEKATQGQRMVLDAELIRACRERGLVPTKSNKQLLKQHAFEAQA